MANFQEHILIKNIPRLNPTICFLLLMMTAQAAYSLPFSITPSGTLPTTVLQGKAITASYNVRNNTQIQRNGNYVKYLPPNVTIANGGCGSAFDLAPGASCTLNLSISGAVNTNDPDPHHHLFVCFPGGVSCAGPSQALNVAVSPSVSGRYTYIPNSDNSTVSLCNVDPNTGNLSGCMSTGNSFSVPRWVAISPSGLQAYVTDSAVNPVAVFLCSVNAVTGALSGCADSGATGLPSALDIIINPAGTFAYITEPANNRVAFCSVNASTGVLSNCIDSGAGAIFNFPYGIVLNKSNSKAYITNLVNSTVTLCNVNAVTGDFSGCSPTGSGFVSPEGIALNSTGTRAYVSNSAAPSVSVCNINSSDGTLNGCTTTGSGFSIPSGITLNSSDTIAYVVNQSSNTVSLCNIDTGTGLFTSCSTSSETGFSGPTGITIS